MTVKGMMGMTGLWSILMASSLAVVFMTYKARLATQQLELLRHEAAELHVESGQLLLEKSALSAYVRVERLAVEKLGMITPQIDRVVIVRP